MCAFIEHKGLKLVYKRYASLYFCCGIGLYSESAWSYCDVCYCRGRGQWVAHAGDHPPLCGAAGPILRQRLWAGHHLQLREGEASQSVSQSLSLSLQAYFILDEFLLAGEIQDSSKKSILNAIRLQDFLQEEETPQGLFEDAGLG